MTTGRRRQGVKNPLLQSLNQQTPTQENGNSSISQVLSDVQSGKLDPRAKVLEMLNVNPGLRALVKTAMPRISSIAKQYGISDADIEAFKAEARI